VVGGGMLDRDVFHAAGFTRVTISNLDSRMTGGEFAPYPWKFANAASLPFQDGSFDYVVVHAAIHHDAEPHRVLTEMYRVALKGLLAFEARDSWVMRRLEQLNMAQTYEHAAVYYNDCKFGGVDNTEVPNFVYRWTEREVEKTIRSYMPSYPHRFVYRYGTALPTTPDLEKKASVRSMVLRIARPLFRLVAALAPRQQNLFAFFVEKPAPAAPLHPWLEHGPGDSGIRFNRAWGDRRYKPHDSLPPRP
jgi:SAM-dependent methyltransferase